MTLLEQIIEDAASRPRAFHFYGPLEAQKVTAFLQSRGWVVPGDIFELWTSVGGLDFFDNEVLFGPITHHSWQDHLDDFNGWVEEAGNANKYVLIHQGSGNTMVDQKTLELRVFDSSDYGNGPSSNYKTCIDWYTQSIRHENQDLWSLPPLSPDTEQSFLCSKGKLL